VMKCIRTVTYVVLVNGKSVGNIRPSRGIRQGDPISPTFSSYVQKLSVLSLIGRNEMVLSLGFQLPLRALG
jgi:hypothetical protein